MTDSKKKKHFTHRPHTEENEKTKRAARIARQSKKMSHFYDGVSNFFARIIRGVSSFIDRVLFNPKYGRLVSLILAVIIYLAVNYNTIVTRYSSTVRSARDVSGVTVTAEYNSDTYEADGLPDTVDITIIGDATSVTTAANSSEGTVVADLEGLNEGTHNVTLKAEGYGDSVTVHIDPSNVIVTLKKKTTRKFSLSYDFINEDKMDDIYTPGTPVFDSSTVNVRASEDTLDSIAFVKALIDCSGQTSDFEQDAKLVAYDSNGQVVNAEIVPETVHVTVPVTSPSKTVSIEVDVSGDVPDDKAIESITLDEDTVTIYGSEETLASIDSVTTTLDASTITKDTTVLRPLVLPDGVSSASINQVNITVTLGDLTTKTVDNVPITYINNTNNYKATQPDNITTTSVIVSGTSDNIADIDADDITVYIDMADASPGLQEFTLQVEEPANGLVRYTLVEDTYELNVIGDSTDDSDTGKGDSNNG